MTDCISDSFDFQNLDRRNLQADFSGGFLSNEGGLLLVSELDQQLGITERLAKCFTDVRDQLQNTGPGIDLFGYRFENQAKVCVRVFGFSRVEFLA